MVVRLRLRVRRIVSPHHCTSIALDLPGSACQASTLILLEPSMSPTFVALLVLTLGVPTLAFVAAMLAAGANPALIGTGVTFFVVLTAVTAMVFEIKRLADQDAGAH
jgi:hypothetical protein